MNRKQFILTQTSAPMTPKQERKRLARREIQDSPESNPVGEEKTGKGRGSPP